MKLAKMYDAAYPGGIPKGYQAIAGYIGGDTPHVWTPSEWRHFGRCKKLPIFVRSTPGDKASGRADGFAALEMLYELKVPAGSPVVYDKETDASPAQVNEFQAVLHWAHYRVWVYGSASTVFANPAIDGYWVADYTGKPFEYRHAKVRATQYATGTKFDSSAIKWWQWTHVMKVW